MSAAAGGPPRISSLLLRVVFARNERREFVYELRILYDARRARDGRRGADRWFRGEVRALLGLLARDGLRGLARAARRPWPAGALHDLKGAWVALRSAPSISVLAVVTLTLGIGANVLIFSIVDNVLLRPLPFAEPQRLVALWPRASFLRAEIALVGERTGTLSGVGAYLELSGYNAELAGGSERLAATAVAPSLLPLLGVQPALGRGFDAQEAEPGHDPVVVLSHAFWRRAFGGDPGVLGAALTLDGQPHTIIGVLPAGFTFPNAAQDVVVPLVMNPADVGLYWGAGGVRAVGRLKPGIDAPAAQAELRRIGRQARDMNPLWTPAEDFRSATVVVPLQQWMVGDVQTNLYLLLAAVGLLLLVACVNVANLLLVRGLTRGHELAVRAALGAGGARLLRQQVFEGLLLMASGCGVALGLAAYGLGPMVRLLPAEIPRAAEIGLDWRVAGACAALALLTGLAVGLLPALQAARVDPQWALRDGGHGGGPSRARRRLSAALVVAQITAAVVLVTASGLLV
ncbi:MAG: ABC transporter permease, partial [Acidobacteriota bacterium]